MMNSNEDKIKQVRDLVEQSRRITVFTGAGISTESGISDYRSQGGLWQKYQPVTFQEFLESEEARREYWRRKKEMYASIRGARPSEGHLAIRRLEASGRLLGVITQNIDGLHKRAGCSGVLELHGTNLEVVCLECSKILPFDHAYERLLEGEAVPRCLGCGGLLKPNTISFGQPLDMSVLSLAFQWTRDCDLMLCAGSSLVVEPAASLPRSARMHGAKLIIINREPTPLDGLADVVVPAEIGPFLKSAIP